VEIASLAALPVGVLSWNSPDPSMTIIVKGTFALDRDGLLPFAEEQQPLSLDRPGTGAGELYVASDFAPRKQSVDLLVVGHVRSQEPTREFPFSLTVGRWSKQWTAKTSEATESVALAARYIGERLAPAPTAPHGWLSRTVAPGFDFSEFNAALPSLRLPDLTRDALLVFEGMLSGTATRRVSLPGVQPCVFYLRDRHGSPNRAQRVHMRADTLWLDIDRAIATVTWRGDVRRALSTSARPAAVLTLEPRGMSYGWSDVEGQLGNADWVPATHEHELRSRDTVPPPTIEGDTRRIRLPRPSLPGSGAASQASADRESLSDLAHRMASGTQVIEPDEEPTMRIDLAAEARSRAASDQAVTQRQPDLGQPDSGQPDSGQPDSGKPDSGRPDVRTDVYVRPRAISATLVSDSTTIPYDPESSLAAGDIIPVEIYARVRAEASQATLAEVLAGRGIEPRVWEINERRQAVAVARDAAEGGQLGREIEAALRAAKLKLTGG
jgi:hypothetical protein